MANLYFEVSALIMLTVFLGHIKFKRIIKCRSNRFFLLFTVLAVTNIIVEIFFVYVFHVNKKFPLWAMMATVTSLRVLRIIVPYSLALYVQSLTGRHNRRNAFAISLMSLPFVIMLIVVALNPITGALSYFDAEGNLMRGRFYPLMNIYAMQYMLICLIFTWVNRRQINHRRCVAVWEIIIIFSLVLTVQIIFNRVLLSGFGLALSVMVLLMTIQNPNDKIDALTGVYQIAGLKDVLEGLCASGREIWLIAVAADGVKRINHVFGMQRGDAVLIQLANALKKQAGDENVFRLGGDKFAAIFFSERQYNSAIVEIRKHFADTMTMGASDVKISACVCCFPGLKCCSYPDRLLALIDYAIVETKTAGNGSEMQVDEQIISQFNRRREIEEYLFTAADLSLFQVYFQPVYSIKRGAFVSAEALARLTHPTLGIISPAEFIPIAEANGLVSVIDRCIFDKVCKFFSMNPQLLDKLTSVKLNVSPADFLGEGLSRKIKKRILEYGLDPAFFQFEITETVATLYGQEIKEWVKDMKNIGAGLCLDDFGSGYANLDSVLRMPFDVAKIDRSMLLAAMESQQAKTLYSQIFTGMEALGFQVVAEGAETQEQVSFLRGLGVDMIQGFYYAKPMCQEDFAELLSR